MFLQVSEPVVINTAVVGQDVGAGQSPAVVVGQVEAVLVELDLDQLLKGGWPHAQVPQRDVIAREELRDVGAFEWKQRKLKVLVPLDVIVSVAPAPAVRAVVFIQVPPVVHPRGGHHSSVVVLFARDVMVVVAFQLDRAFGVV